LDILNFFGLRNDVSLVSLSAPFSTSRETDNEQQLVQLPHNKQKHMGKSIKNGKNPSKEWSSYNSYTDKLAVTKTMVQNVLQISILSFMLLGYWSKPVQGENPVCDISRPARAHRQFHCSANWRQVSSAQTKTAKAWSIDKLLYSYVITIFLQLVVHVTLTDTSAWQTLVKTDVIVR
jgi:hypothetical protein